MSYEEKLTLDKIIQNLSKSRYEEINLSARWQA